MAPSGTPAKPLWREYILIVLSVLVMAVPGLTTLPSIDRDESRYAQASAQMVESGDYVNIRFQERARNKKPAGAYWAQAAVVKLFGTESARHIWVHRIPSILAAICAALLTFWAGRALVGRRPAFYGTIFLTLTLIFTWEAKAAKTDMLLLAATMLSLGALAWLRRGPSKKLSVLFWVGMGLSIMIKGPLGPAVVATLMGTLALWERNGAWLKPLLYWPGPVLALFIVLPWMIAIWIATDGQFFADALGQDFAPKLVSGQENHGAPPGMYLATIWLFFWPSAIFLLAGFAFAIRAVRSKDGGAIPASARFLLCWAVPIWLVMEIVPTKLPHYLLLLYPAYALLCGVAYTTLAEVKEFPVTRRIGAVLFLVFGTVFAVLLPLAQAQYGPEPSWTFGVMGVLIILVLLTAIRVWNGGMDKVLPMVMSAGVIWAWAALVFVIPTLPKLQTAEQVREIYAELDLVRPADGGPLLHSPSFTEPSLVFEMGTEVRLGETVSITDPEAMARGDVLLSDRMRQESVDAERAFEAAAAANNMCVRTLREFNGYNYNGGDEMKLALLRAEPCLIETPPEDSE